MTAAVLIVGVAPLLALIAFQLTRIANALEAMAARPGEKA